MMMSMGFQLLTVPRMECGTCGQPMNEKNAIAEALLFGAKQYSICPTCFKEVPESMQTRGYKSKWTRRVNKIRRRQNERQSTTV